MTATKYHYIITSVEALSCIESGHKSPKSNINIARLKLLIQTTRKIHCSLTPFFARNGNPRANEHSGAGGASSITQGATHGTPYYCPYNKACDVVFILRIIVSLNEVLTKRSLNTHGDFFVAFADKNPTNYYQYYDIHRALAERERRHYYDINTLITRVLKKNTTAFSTATIFISIGTGVRSKKKKKSLRFPTGNMLS